MPTLDDLETLAKFTDGLTGKDLVPVTDQSGDASGPSKVKKLSPALLGLGYTHGFKITHANSGLLGDTDTDITTIDLMDLPTTCFIARTTCIVKTKFIGGSTSSASIDVGRTGDLDSYVDALDCFSNNSVQETDSGSESPGFNTTASQALKFSITPGGAGTDEFTQGEAYVFISLIDMDEIGDLSVKEIT
tara:strand:- start:10293 stop:10862 length:570 start_codon:yes stop_codon:yes gene_type:complete